MLHYSNNFSKCYRIANLARHLLGNLAGKHITLALFLLGSCDICFHFAKFLHDLHSLLEQNITCILIPIFVCFLQFLLFFCFCYVQCFLKIVLVSSRYSVKSDRYSVKSNSRGCYTCIRPCYTFFLQNFCSKPSYSIIFWLADKLLFIVCITRTSSI